MPDKFYDWLARKYGFWKSWFYEQDEEYQETLIREYCSIANWR